jgi:two-component sensor histidine kinase
MRFVSDIAVPLACLSAALALLLYRNRRKRLSEDDFRPCWLAVIGLLAYGASRAADLLLTWAPGMNGVETLGAVALGLAVMAGFAIWGLLPAMLARPSPSELLKANVALSDAVAQDAVEREQLGEAAAALEQALAARTRELDETNRRFVNALENTGIAMAQQDIDLRYVWVHNLPDGLCSENIVGRLQKDVLPASTEPIFAEAKRRAMAQMERVVVDVPLELNGETRWYKERIEPLSRDGRVVGVLTTAIDTTAHRRQEEELRSLLLELTHRTKNLLAVIMGVARQSSRSTADIDTFVSRFNGRIRTLSVAHDLLLDAKWRKVDLRELIEGVWQTTAPRFADRLTLSGADAFVGRESAQNLALAIHEMASNAIEHGCLRDAEGKVQVSWASSVEHETAGVELLWEETGCSSTALSHFTGFGKSFVQILLPRATGGRSDVNWTAQGLSWRLWMPEHNFVTESQGPERSADWRGAGSTHRA